MLKLANKIIQPAINYLIKKNVKKLFLDVQNYQLQFLLLNLLKQLNHQKYF